MSRILLATISLICFTDTVLNAQDRIPREYVNPDEIISFDRQTSFPDAMSILADFVMEREERFLIDRTGYSGSIGVTLPPMHWKDALQYIMRVQNMVLYEDPEFYEVLTRQQLRDRSVNGTRASESQTPRTYRATTRTREVRINATFFEGSRRALREVGVDWSTLTNMTPANVGNYLTGQGGQTLPGQFENRFVSVNARGAQSVSQNVFNSLINFGDVGAGIEVQALFSAFEADNLGEVLATPSIKVMDGELGRIQVGEDFSIKQRDFAGNVTDQFFSTGTILTVTPQIIEYQDTTFIYLDLSVERSSAQPDPVSTVISKEEASTHSLLLNGESTVIAGLYRTDRSEVRRGIPLLKDLPPWFFGLRYLFGFNSTDISQTELVVLVQAELEDSIPERLVRQLQSKRDLLELQQRRHREEMDFIPGQEVQRGLLDPGMNGPEAESVQPAAPIAVSTDNTELQEPVSIKEVHETIRPSARPEVRTVQREAVQPQVEPQRAMANQTLPVESPVVQTSVSELDREPIRALDIENIRSQEAQLRYYTIAGSFREQENAESAYQQLLRDGYDAHLLYEPGRDLYRVAYAGFTNKNEGIRYTREIQRTRHPEAWLSVNSH